MLAGQSAPAHAAREIHPILDVLIDVGHGGIDGGTSYENLLEKEINLQIAQLLYQRLAEKGYVIALNRTNDYALSDDNRWLQNPSRHLRDLAQRKHLAMELRPQAMISLHVNWSRDARKSGPLVLYQKNNQSYFLAELMQNALNRLYQTKGIPVKGKTYYVLNHSACPTVIVEMGFISNQNDRQMLTEAARQKQIAETIAAAVDEYFFLLGHINGRKQTQADEPDEGS
jgi:N-acetylmuramoyl-L-alanine amidase